VSWAKNVWVIVPAYNEAGRLPTEKFRHFFAARPNLRFLFVNDGSEDNTDEILAELVKETPHEVLNLPSNRGKAEAVRVGLLQAIEKDGAGVVAFWDADLATPLASIVNFLEILETRTELQVITGARVLLCGRIIKRSTHRHYVGRVFATLVSNLLAFPIYDTQCGAKMFRVTDALRSSLEEPFLTRWLFDVELLVRLQSQLTNHLSEQLYEYPLEQWCDQAGSKLTLMDFIKAPRELWRIAQHYNLPQAMRKA